MSAKNKDKPKTRSGDDAAGANMADIASLLESHRASMAADFKSAFEVLEARLGKTHALVVEHGQKIDSLESNATLQDQRMSALEEKCAALAASNAKLGAKTADLEGRSRRNNIRIIGLPESIEGPRPSSFFSELLVELLGSETLSSPPELDRAHRSLTAKPAVGARPRPVIIRVHRYQVKDLIIREARKRRGTLQYRGAPVQIFEDYTQEVVEQRAQYREVMAKLYNLGLRPALQYPARLLITVKDGAKKRFASAEEAAAFITSYQ